MVQRYDDWDKKRYKTTRSMPWWYRRIRLFQYIGWGGIFIYAFGDIYKMLLFPSKHAMIVRSLEPRNTDEAIHLQKNIEQREKALYLRALGEEKTPGENVTDLR